MVVLERINEINKKEGHYICEKARASSREEVCWNVVQN